MDSIKAKVNGELKDETPLPYFFDVVAFDTLENKALKEDIERVGVVFYVKK